jgi:signal transduction histidine kinase
LPEISTDKERLTQILINLITNSIKYTHKGKITVSALKDGTGVHFIIKDTGIGISKKDQPKIFTRFYQVDSSYTRSAGGVGLGLSLCKEFVERLGGKIWFTSVAGKGSEFHFILPKSPSIELKNNAPKTIY